MLDLRNRDQVLAFIGEHLAYLPDAERKKAATRYGRIEDSRTVTPEDLAAFARDVGRDSWPARRALAAHLMDQEGCEEEWKRVVTAVSPATGHLLSRFRKGTKCVSLDETLAHEESDAALGEAERTEIAHVRAAIRETMWKDAQEQLTELADAARADLNEIVSRLQALRTLAEEMPWMQDELLSKITRFEDDLYFAGKTLEPDILDRELAYYREEKAIPTEG